MKIDIYNIEKFIKVNNLKEVTNPIIMEKDHIPTRDGLLSTDIFGRTVDERKGIYAYIDLHTHFFHPYLFKVVKRLDRRFEEIVAGLLRVKITPDGEMINDETGDTGLEFLYKNFKKIKFKKNESVIRNERIDLFNSLDIDEIFCKYWIVCPAFYRDIQMNKSSAGKVSYNEINTFYSKLIRMSGSLKHDTGIEIVSNSTKNKIQQTLVDIYDSFTGEIKGKDGMTRQFVMGKSIDYGVRSVISSPIFEADTIEDMDVDFYHCGIPISIACTNFFPFIVKWVKDYFYNNIYLRKDNYPIMRKDGTKEMLQLTDVDRICSDEYITKGIDLFIHSYGDRFKKIPLKNDKGYNINLGIVGRYALNDTITQDSSTIMRRAATWTDILYMAAVNVTKDKHVVITRYPLEDYFGTFPNKIAILSTTETKPVMINKVLYKKYPVIDPKLPPSKVSTLFIDTVTLSNLYLKGLGGDRDNWSPYEVTHSEKLRERLTSGVIEKYSIANGKSE